VEGYSSSPTVNLHSTSSLVSLFNDSVDEACFKSQQECYKQLEKERSQFYESAVKADTGLVTQVSIFETIKSYGEGNLYMVSDGITRFRFIEQPTSSSFSLVTVTRTKLNATFIGATGIPSCTIPTTVCERLWSSQFSQLGNTEGTAISTLEPLGKICPVSQECDFRRQGEVNLIYWPVVKDLK
jgi:hypothetical protein